MLSFIGTDLCEDIATMLPLVSFSALRLAEFTEIVLSVNKIRLSSVNDTQFLHSYMLSYGLRSFIIN
jgi:intergrase/recombinase